MGSGQKNLFVRSTWEDSLGKPIHDQYSCDSFWYFRNNRQLIYCVLCFLIDAIHNFLWTENVRLKVLNSMYMKTGLWGIYIYTLYYSFHCIKVLEYVILTTHCFYAVWRSLVYSKSFRKCCQLYNGMLLNNSIHWSHCTSIPRSLICIPVQN